MSNGNDSPLHSFYTSRQWKRMREYVLSRDKGLCQRCLRYGIINPGTIVHHKEELTMDNVNDPSIALNEENLISVCFDCHRELHNHIQHNRYKIDENGDLIDEVEW